MPTDINAEFNKLQARGAQCDTSFAKAEHAIYEALVETYLFFQKYRDDEQFLIKKYAADNITWTERGNEVNFRPLIRLIFRLDIPNASEKDKARQSLTLGSQRNRVADYELVMKLFHDAWTENPDDYKTGAYGKLLKLIHENSIQSLVRAKNDKSQLIKGKAKAEDASEIKATRNTLALASMANMKAQPTALAKFKPSKIDDIDFNSDGLAACICRYNERTKAFEILAASNDDQTIHAIAADVSGHVDNVETRALRTISEVIATQCFPGKYIPDGDRAKLQGTLASWYKTVYLENSNIVKPSKAAKGSKSSRAVQTHRRLLLRGKQAIILSAQRTDASVVTILIPPKDKEINPSATADVSLRADNLRRVEEWIENGTIAARKSKPANKLGNPAEGTKAKYALLVDNPHAAAKPQYLHFEDIHRPAVRDGNMGQVDVERLGFKANWSFSCDRYWLQSLRREFLDKWFSFAASGRKLKRNENALLEITIDKKAITFGYEIDIKGRNPTTRVKLAETARVDKSQSYLVFAKDLMPALYNLGNISIIGKLELSGDADAMFMRFKTEMGDYTIAIPTVQSHGKSFKRNTRWFKVYGAKA